MIVSNTLRSGSYANHNYKIVDNGDVISVIIEAFKKLDDRLLIAPAHAEKGVAIFKNKVYWTYKMGFNPDVIIADIINKLFKI